MNKPAVIYARYSDDKQTEQSIEGQLKACYSFAAQQGYTVIGEYIDRAQSARTDARPEFLRMVEDSARRQYEVIIVYQLDRFSRNRYDSATYKARLKKNGVKVLSARENISDDASGVLMEAVLEGMAEYFSAELSQKVKRGMEINAQKCYFNGGTIPFGYKTVRIAPADERSKKVLAVDEAVAPFVVEIFERFAAGQTVKEITDYMNAKNIRTASGCEFNNSSLHHMLKNKRYKGTYHYGGVEIADGLPRIVSNELFSKVGEVMEINKNAPGKKSRAKTEYLLTMKLFCGHCRDMMVGVSGNSSTGKKHCYYRCNTAWHKNCDKKNVPKALIEDRVVSLAREQLTDENIAKIAAAIEAICKQEREDADYKRLEKMKRDAAKQKSNLVDALKFGKATATIVEEITKLEASQDDIERQLILEKAKHMDLTAEHVAFFLNKLRDGDIDDNNYRRVIITVLVNSVYLYDDRLTVIFNASDKPVEVTKQLLDDIKESCDLPAKSSHDFGVVTRPRLERGTPCLKGRCSAD